MEYLEGGSLQGLIKSSANNLDEATTQWILKEMLKVPERPYGFMCLGLKKGHKGLGLQQHE